MLEIQYMYYKSDSIAAELINHIHLCSWNAVFGTTAVCSSTTFATVRRYRRGETILKTAATLLREKHQQKIISDSDNKRVPGENIYWELWACKLEPALGCWCNPLQPRTAPGVKKKKNRQKIPMHYPLQIFKVGQLHGTVDIKNVSFFSFLFFFQK